MEGLIIDDKEEEGSGCERAEAQSQEIGSKKKKNQQESSSSAEESRKHGQEEEGRKKKKKQKSKNRCDAPKSGGKRSRADFVGTSSGDSDSDLIDTDGISAAGTSSASQSDSSSSASNDSSTDYEGEKKKKKKKKNSSIAAAANKDSIDSKNSTRSSKHRQPLKASLASAKKKKKKERQKLEKEEESKKKKVEKNSAREKKEVLFRGKKRSRTGTGTSGVNSGGSKKAKQDSKKKDLWSLYEEDYDSHEEFERDIEKLPPAIKRKMFKDFKAMRERCVERIRKLGMSLVGFNM
jgi:hypothetical protein